MINTKGFASFVLIVIVFVVIIVVGYFRLQTKIPPRPEITNQHEDIETTISESDTFVRPSISVSENSGWNKLTDTKLGIGFEYPSNWFLRKKSTNGNLCVGKHSEDQRRLPVFCYESDPYVKVDEDVFSSTEDSIQQDFFEKISSEVGTTTIDGSYRYMNIRSFDFQGYPAIERVSDLTPGTEGTENHYLREIYINHPEKGLKRLLFSTYYKEEYQENKEVFDQILSSFKFIN